MPKNKNIEGFEEHESREAPLYTFLFTRKGYHSRDVLQTCSIDKNDKQYLKVTYVYMLVSSKKS